MTNVIQFPRKGEHIISEYEKLIAEFREAVALIFTPDPDRGLDKLRKFPNLGIFPPGVGSDEVQAGE